MGKQIFRFNQKSIRWFVIRQLILIVGIIFAASVLRVLKTGVNTASSDMVVQSVSDQFAGNVSRLEMDVAVRAAYNISGVVSMFTTLIIMILIVLLVLEWIPVIRAALKKYSTGVKE
jgi:hypothetical protein